MTPSWWSKTSCGISTCRKNKGRNWSVIAVEAVNEVGNPTILATFAVIAAVLPMALRGRTHGALHAAHPGRLERGDVLLAGDCLHRDAVGFDSHPALGQKVFLPDRGDGRPEPGQRICIPL